MKIMKGIFEKEVEHADLWKQIGVEAGNANREEIERGRDR